MPAQRVLFVIRGKLGDSLVLYAMVRAYIESRPQDQVSLLIRRDYALLLMREPGLRIIPFNSRVEMMARLLWLRLAEPAFDVLAALWGFGNPVPRIAQLTRAKRKIYLDGRYPKWYPEWPASTFYPTLVDPAWLVTSVFAPGIAKPLKLEVPGLAVLRHSVPRAGAIGVIPAANEDRRTFDLETLEFLLAAAAALHPGKPIWLLVNPRDRGADSFLSMTLPMNVEIRRFASLESMLDIVLELGAYYGTDTGVYHLAAAMGIPSTVFFGPTEPRKIVLPEQPGASWLRLKVLGDTHCEIRDCRRPLCVYQCVASFAGTVSSTPLEATPAACPLRASGIADLSAITRHPPSGQNMP
jgi:ADP-heptose:LPS heptosyltransferase